MSNNFVFWKEYNANTINKILNLIDQQKRRNATYVFADFHMHSNMSSDGKQTLKEILENTKQKGFDIISITDHDDVRIYDELFEFVQNNDMSQYPIVITGIEHTVSYPKYGEMCHILKHFINPKDKDLLRDIEILEESYFNRAKRQINRLHESSVLTKIFDDYKIDISYENFLSYLKSKDIRLPDYAPLIDYLADEFKTKGVSYAKLFDDLITENQTDPCQARKEKKQKRFEKLKAKYEGKEIEDNRRFLLSILAVRGVDDDIYEGYPSSGSLSVNEYGQPNIFKLNHNGITTFAHPTEAVVNTVLDCADIGGKLYAVERNIKNPYKDMSSFYKVKEVMNVCELVGSDAHAVQEDVYEDMGYYKIEIAELENYINSFREEL